jgi:hypothetical protein
VPPDVRTIVIDRPAPTDAFGHGTLVAAGAHVECDRIELPADRPGPQELEIRWRCAPARVRTRTRALRIDDGVAIARRVLAESRDRLSPLLR